MPYIRPPPPEGPYRDLDDLLQMIETDHPNGGPWLTAQIRLRPVTIDPTSPKDMPRLMVGIIHRDQVLADIFGLITEPLLIPYAARLAAVGRQIAEEL